MTQRKELDRFGRKGRKDSVRVVREPVRGASRIRVLWKVGARRHTELFADTRAGISEALTFAEALSDELRAPVAAAPAEFPALTLRQLYEKYVAANGQWREKTLTTHNTRWTKVENVLDRKTLATAITRESLDDLKNRMMAAKHSVYQVRQHLALVVAVFKFGVDRDLIPPNKVTFYRAKFGRDQKRQKPTMAEYTKAERESLAAVLSPRDPRLWRAWVATVLFAYCGPRQNAALHLEWPDVDFHGDRLRWAPETAKMGEEFWQPMPAPVREALWVAYGWRTARGYAGRFVLFAASDKRQKRDVPMTYGSYNTALHDAEKLAGIEPIKYRAAHGFRRGIAGDIHAQTGSEKAAADWLGDRSTKIVRDHYLLRRDEDLRKTADLISGETSDA